MRRIIEGTPGEEAEVWIQDKGAHSPRLRARLVIEDLSEVLTSISSRNGANGPNNPVTQYILAQAAEYLAERLIDDANPGRDGRDSVPRTLSSALGHQPFIEGVLNMSQHQMLRRWPLATDWYQDVINYVMRPSRFTRATDEVAKQFEIWAQGSLGDLMRNFSDTVFRIDGDPKVLRMAEALQALWPEYPPVKAATITYHQQIQTMWAPLYERVLNNYGLQVRPELTFAELGWGLNALQTRETWERLAGIENEQRPLGGHRWTITARDSLILLAGGVTGVDGTVYSPTELAALMPVHKR